MPTLLAIDTCSTKCKVALLHQGSVSLREGNELQKTAQNILVLIDDLLTEAGLVYNQLDALAVVTGPGSFTGVRIGVAITQGLSLSSSTPVVAISSLAILASAASQKFDGDLFLSCMKARENEVYFGVYQCTGDDVRLVGSEQVNATGAVSSQELAGERLRIFIGIGDGWIYRKQLEKSLSLELTLCVNDNFTSMEDVCRLAAARYRKGDVVKEEQVLPNYVKEQMDYS